MIGGVQLTHQEITLLVAIGIIAYCWLMKTIWGKD